MLRSFILGTAQDHGNNFFSANVHQCNIAFKVLHAQVCLKSSLPLACTNCGIFYIRFSGPKVWNSTD